MNPQREIELRDRKIEAAAKKIHMLKEEIEALTQLLDCAAANLVLLANKKNLCKVSRKSVSEILGKYTLSATCDDNGNYLLQVVEKD